MDCLSTSLLRGAALGVALALPMTLGVAVREIFNSISTEKLLEMI